MLAGRRSRHHHVSVAALVLFCLFTFAFAHTSFAQITAATLSGTIKDQTGALLRGVGVVVENPNTGLTRSGTSDAIGHFTMAGLPPGTYEVRASLPGFGTVVERVTLAVAQETGLHLILKVTGTEESIMVLGVSSVVDTRSAALSAVVTEKTISELPLNGRNYMELALLQPGVASFNEKDSGAGSSNRGIKLNINGMTFRSNSYLLDGANMRGYPGTVTGSAAGTTLGVETIQEFRVVTNAYSADYGRAMGGVVSLVTKSGTNRVRGSGFEFFRDSALDARDYFDRGADPPPFRRNQFGASVGGPIRKNRLFFFGGAERLQEDLGTTTISYVPSDAARSGALGTINPTVRPYLDLYPRANGGEVGVNTGIGVFSFEDNQPTRENFFQGRVDYTLSARDAAFVRYTSDGADQTNTAGFPDYAVDSVSRNQFFTAEYRRIVSSTVLNTTRFSHSRLRFEGLPAFPSVPDLAFIAGQNEIGVINVTGSYTALGGTAQNPNTSNSFYWTGSNDASYAKGRHVLKTGVLIEHLRTNKLTATNVRGSYTFANVQTFLAGTPTRFVGVPPGAQLERVRPNTLFGFYVQDDYHATDRLTLNLGLRYEFYTVPSERDGLDTTLRDIVTDATFTVGPPFARNPSLQNWAPRVGFAWDMNGDGRTAIRGGAGIYHDTDGPFNSAFGVAAFSPPFAATATITNPTFPMPASLTAGAASARTLDYNISQPYGLAFNVSAQREFGGQITGTVGYAGSRAYHLVTAIEGNPFIPQIQDGTKFFPVGTPRRNPAFGPIDYRTNGGHSEYHALQLSAQKRFSRRYQLQAAYTLSKAMDNQQAQLFMDVNNSSVYPQDPYDREVDWARSDFDVRHLFSSNFVWDLPGLDRHALFGGWQFNGIVVLRSGVPFTPALGATNWSRSGNTSGEDRPNLKPGVNLHDVVLGGPDRYFDTSAFELGPPGYFGNAGRNILSGPNYAMTSVSLVKNTRVDALGAGGQVQVRLEVFNLMNRPNFATPDRIVFAAATTNEAPLATAGRITRTITSSRQVQLGVKILF